MSSFGISQEHIEAVLKLKQTVDKAASVIINRLKDKTISLDERWKVYEKLVAEKLIVKVDSCSDGDIDILETIDGSEVTPHDDFYIERHETKSYVDLYENMMNYSISENLVPESIDRWREKVLENPDYASFTYDW